MKKDRFFDLLPDYVLDLHPEDLKVSVETHLESGCADCRAELKSLQETFHLLPYGLAQHPVSAEVKKRIDNALEDVVINGKQRISHYKLLRKLGAGAMGEVYLAEDTRLGRSTALKIIRPEVATNLERKKRFLREARAAAVLNHPGIATIFEVGEDDGTEFIAMEYAEGRPLTQVISGKPMLPERVVQIALQLAAAVAEAHQRGILHRDLKPDNVHIGQGDRVKILDFGLAKFMETRLEDDYLTSSERIMGTIPYMSPEQIEGRTLDPSSDVFSIGSILYEMLTGISPFSGGNASETIENILRVTPPALSLRARVPAALEKIIERSLQKDPARRYPSARELEADLQALSKGETVIIHQARASISIAVLYFENLSEEKESDYFRAGMTEDIIVELSKIRSWEVRPRTQVVRYKDQELDLLEVGRELKVSHILQGSIRKAGQRFRISAQLVDARTASAVWAERYDRDLKDVFEIQSEIAHRIAAALQVHLTSAEKKEIAKRPTENLEAYDYYLRGREMIFRLTKQGIDNAIEYFSQAIRTDARYALAYAGLAQADAIKLSFYGGPDSLADVAIENARKALDLDPDLAQAHAALGLAYFLKGQSEQALEECLKAIELNPYDAFATWVSGRLVYRLNQYEEAVWYFKRTVELLPDFYTAYSDLGQAYANWGLQERALEAHQKAVEAARRYLQNFPDEPRAHIFLATSLATLGARIEATAQGRIAAALSPDDPVMMYNLACLYSQLDDLDTAMNWLKKSVDSGRFDLEWIKRDPDLANLRNHPEYQALIAES
jgi:serine/threonine protein kinase/Flp pilus assembly protein TadD